MGRRKNLKRERDAGKKEMDGREKKR
jgi:hypothetical protein